MFPLARRPPIDLLVSLAACLAACGTTGETPASPAVVTNAQPPPSGDASAPLPPGPVDAGALSPGNAVGALPADGGSDGGGNGDARSVAAAPATPTLLLPWTGGETWYLTSGPHAHNRAALDFAPPNFNPRTKRAFPDSCSRLRGNAHWVRAAAAGRISSVLRNACPVVQIEHDDGTTTNYFHLRRRSVKELRLKVGDLVEAGQILGHPSCETGPKVCGATHAASGVHVHFYRTAAGTAKRLPADGMIISGWRVRALRRIREGTMTKDGDVRSARGIAVGRACSPTVGACKGQRNDLLSDNVSDASGPAVSLASAAAPTAGTRRPSAP